jgi:hypothetical protein
MMEGTGRVLLARLVWRKHQKQYSLSGRKAGDITLLALGMQMVRRELSAIHPLHQLMHHNGFWCM